MEDRQLNRGATPTVPNVVPQSYTPRPEQFQKPITQDLRNEQARLAHGFALSQIEHLENQRHLSPNRREAKWMHMLYDEAGNEVGIGYHQSQYDARLDQAIKDSKTARTVMMDKISEWAGNLDRDQMAEALPQIWKSFLPSVEQETPAEMVEEALVEEEVVPVDVLQRPEVDFASLPKSEVVAPDQLSFGDLMGMIEQGNKD